jgi:membrane protease YdiL (CAAX protease family)
MSAALNELSVDSRGPVIAADRRTPRVWTVFVAMVAALLAAIMLQIVVVIGLIAWAAAKGQPIEEVTKQLPQQIGTPGMFILLAACGQLAFALAAIVPAMLSSTPIRQRLGLLPAQPSWTVYPLTMFGSLMPLAVGLGLALALAQLVPGDPSVARLFENMTPAMAVPFVLFIALAPGVCEELLFRGYVQRRLLARWRPLVAIGVTSFCFSLMHVMPHAIVATLPLGLWFGVIAWRSGSIVPCIACHAFVNGSVNAYRMVVKFGEISETAQWIAMATSLLVGLICFIASCRLLRSAPDGSRGAP